MLMEGAGWGGVMFEFLILQTLVRMYCISVLFTNCRYCTSSCSGAMLLVGSIVTSLKSVGCSYWA